MGFIQGKAEAITSYRRQLSLQILSFTEIYNQPHHRRLMLQANQTSCALFMGTWVYDESYLLYQYFLRAQSLTHKLTVNVRLTCLQLPQVSMETVYLRASQSISRDMDQLVTLDRGLRTLARWIDTNIDRRKAYEWAANSAYSVVTASRWVLALPSAVASPPQLLFSIKLGLGVLMLYFWSHSISFHFGRSVSGRRLINQRKRHKNMEAKPSVQGSSLLGESSKQEHIVVEKYDAEEEGGHLELKTPLPVLKMLQRLWKKMGEGKGLLLLSFWTTRILTERSHSSKLETKRKWFLGLEAIHKLRGTWKILHKFSINKFGWLVFRFHKEDRERILEGGPYMIYRRPLILKKIPLLFEFGACTNTVIPVWTTLRGLPLDLWNDHALPKICSKIGNPLCTNAMTRKKDRISYARVLVIVDVVKALVLVVPIMMPNGNIREHVIYENLPKFCLGCKIMDIRLKGVEKDNRWTNLSRNSRPLLSRMEETRWLLGKEMLWQIRSSKVIGRQTWPRPLIQAWFRTLIQKGSKVLIQVWVYVLLQ
ncbi:hypothetical protein M9H77_16651 [Catharanthus roseus]|uniref:Uncharacterized protein n=1 Tax=Catharanthus roseus TaxID=4058 RepID=A0ACC0B2D0_CATRO|nr:hypothetical protein M9H77_16651 [Catharanthus roseus]